jgi:hypothetical protein
MPNEEHLEILKQGVEVWNRWREENPEIKPNLGGEDLSGMDLSGINFHRVSLGRANLRGSILVKANLNEAYLRKANLGMATLSEANLQEAHLSNVILCEADLNEAQLDGAFLSRADLSKANLRGVTCVLTNFTEANLSRVDLTAACFLNTILGDTDLTDAKGLDCCEHWGPSVIDYRTLVRSGRLPLSFLRGCGLPDVMIDYLPSLLHEPIQLYSVFISYSHQDEEFAQRLYDALQGKGVRCWYAPEDIQGGKKIHEQIDEAIRVYDKLLLIFSEHSMQSNWVKTEIRRARKAELAVKQRKFFPIRLVSMEAIQEWTFFNADAGEDLDAEIREYFIPDFSNWEDHDSFEHAFARLLRDLKADDTQPST